MPMYIRDGRLRAMKLSGAGEERGKSGRELAEMVRAGRAWDALRELRDKHLDGLEGRYEAAADVLQSIVTEVKSLRKELKSLAPELYAECYGGGDMSGAEACFALVRGGFEPLRSEAGDEAGVGRKKGGAACKKCRKLYKINGELLKEINGE